MSLGLVGDFWVNEWILQKGKLIWLEKGGKHAQRYIGFHTVVIVEHQEAQVSRMCPKKTYWLLRLAGLCWHLIMEN